MPATKKAAKKTSKPAKATRKEQKTKLTDEIRKTLQIARLQIRDLVAGFRTDDCVEPPKATADSITAILGDSFDWESGESEESLS
jgi:hypothetical protein